MIGMAATITAPYQPGTQADPLQANTELFVAAPGTATLGLSGRLSGATTIRPIRTTTTGSAAFSRSRKRAGIKRVYMAAGFYFLNSNFWGSRGQAPLLKRSQKRLMGKRVW